jgi:hypothetical protein
MKSCKNPLLFLILLAVVICNICQIAYAGQRIVIHQHKYLLKVEKQGNNPDYSNLKLWASHPYKHDPADSIPAFLQNEIRDSNVDVFFLHPTTYTGKFKGWNADINDERINANTDKGTILFQASVFNGSCRVFAPRYRQAHLRAFFTKDTIEAAKALDFAYQDLKNAFQYYLDHWNHGRPIIIASHSQGTRHGIRLLQEFFDGKPLQKQLVCAYLVGYRIKKDAFKNIPWGTTPNSIGCVVGWRTYKNGYVPPFVKKENGDCLCINPVSWTTSNNWSPKSLHKGFLLRNFNELKRPGELSVCIASEYNILWIDLPKKLKRKYGFIKNFHIADYNLFYINIRQNVKERVKSYMKR